ncbi:MAG: tetratricopeptide repeat protein [Candidatus Cloacimonetes bacterium]|nr:tetratricopeptide repeat protein [Candidatus Cloacimonadota bacterium]
MRKNLMLLSLMILLVLSNCKSQYMRSGNVYLQQNLYDKAMEQFQLEVEQNPDNLEAYKNIAGIYYEEKQYVKAYHYYGICNTKIKSDPAQYREYQQDVNQLLKNSWLFLFQDAKNLLDTEQYDKAVIAFQELKDLSPDSVQVYIALGTLYRITDDLQEALNAFQKASELDPNSISVKLQLAYLYYSTENYQESINIYQDILSREPDNRDALSNLAILYQETDNLNSALHAYEKLVQVYPEDTEALLELASLQYNNGEFLSASEYYIRVHELEPENINVLSALCYALNSAENWEKLLPYAERWHQLEPDNKNPLYLLVNATGPSRLDRPSLFENYLARLRLLENK